MDEQTEYCHSDYEPFQDVAEFLRYVPVKSYDPKPTETVELVNRETGERIKIHPEYRRRNEYWWGSKDGKCLPYGDSTGWYSTRHDDPMYDTISLVDLFEKYEFPNGRPFGVKSSSVEELAFFEMMKKHLSIETDTESHYDSDYTTVKTNLVFTFDNGRTEIISSTEDTI